MDKIFYMFCNDRRSRGSGDRSGINQPITPPRTLKRRSCPADRSLATAPLLFPHTPHPTPHTLKHMVRIPTHQAPPHPGEILLEDFLKPMEIAPGSLADAIGLSLADIDKILSGSRGISPSTALRLAKFFGTTHDFWINLQSCWDVYHVQTQEATELVIPFCLLAATVSIPPTPL